MLASTASYQNCEAFLYTDIYLESFEKQFLTVSAVLTDA